MRIISTSSGKEPLHLIPQPAPADDFIKSHPARSLFSLGIIEASARTIKLEIEAREQTQDCRSEIRATLGCVIDYAARLVGGNAIGSCDLLEYEVTLRGEVKGATFLVYAQLVTATDDTAAYHCAIYAKQEDRLVLVADSQGTLVKRISG